MPQLQAQASFYIVKERWLLFQSYCRRKGKFASQVLREMIESFIETCEFDEQIQKEKAKNE